MSKYALIAAAAVAAAALPLASTADATTFLFDVTDSSGTVLSGDFITSGSTLTSSYGSGQAVTALMATLTAGAAGFSPTGAATLVANPSGQTQTSSSGSFVYDDLYDGTTGTHLATGFTNGGLLFTVGGVEYNLFNAGGGAYTLYEQFTNGGPGTNETVSLNVTSAVPEAGTWAFILLGFAVVGGVMRTRARAASVSA